MAKKSVKKKLKKAKKTVKLKRQGGKASFGDVKEKTGVCPTCGYTMKWLHNGSCPLCRVCVRCKNRVRHCTCLEGE